jgi:cell division control protein 6
MPGAHPQRERCSRRAREQASRWCASSADAVDAAKEALECSDAHGPERSADARVDTLLSSFLQHRVCAGALLSGPPGTGKTRALERARETASASSCPAVWVSCMGASTGDSALAELAGTSDGTAAVRKLRRLAASGKQLLLLVDEADALEGSSQWALREVLLLLSERKASVCVMLAANRRNFFRGLLRDLHDATVSLETLQFGAFTAEELKAIIASRLSALNNTYSCEDNGCNAVFENNALELCCRRVAATSGDARRAIECCCAAVDKHARSAGRGKVGVKAAHAATSECLQQSGSSAVESLPQENKVLALAAAHLARKRANPSVEALVDEYTRRSAKSGLHPVGVSEVMQMCEALSEQGILSLAPAQAKRKRRDTSARTFELKVVPDVIHHALGGE